MSSTNLKSILSKEKFGTYIHIYRYFMSKKILIFFSSLASKSHSQVNGVCLMNKSTTFTKKYYLYTMNQSMVFSSL